MPTNWRAPSRRRHRRRRPIRSPRRRRRRSLPPSGPSTSSRRPEPNTAVEGDDPDAGPTGPLAVRSRRGSQHHRSRSGTRVLLVSTSGFDTHADQLDHHQQLLDDLAKGVSGFFSTLQQKGHADRVLLITTSEFGRRPPRTAARAPTMVSGVCSSSPDPRSRRAPRHGRHRPPHRRRSAGPDRHTLAVRGCPRLARRTELRTARRLQGRPPPRQRLNPPLEWNVGAPWIARAATVTRSSDDGVR